MVMLALTIGSFVLAVLFGLLAWRFAHEERRRSEARVTALAAAIDGSPATSPAMFTQHRRSAVQGRPLLKLGIGFAFAVAVIVLIAMSSGRRDVERPVVADRVDAPEPSVATTGTPLTLELLSMTHDRTSEALTVTGLVRNAGASSSGGLTAVVFAFDRDGNYVASGRALLDFPRLAAGDESPFRVRVPDVKDVGRYRVSFRTDTGVVRHVDRRPAFAAKAAAAGKSAFN
jgi:hypothetical protein